MNKLTKCPNCGTWTKLEVCPNCETIVSGENKGKDAYEVKAAKSTKKKK